MRLLAVILVLLALLLQYPLWFGEGGLLKVWQLRKTVEQREAENAEQVLRNRTLEAEVRDLKQGVQAVEERARDELGMVREGETFFQVVENPASSSDR